MTPHLVDAHCHIATKSFTKEWIKNLKKWEQTGLSAIIGTSMTIKECEQILALARDSSIIMPAIGIHPWQVKKSIEQDSVYSYFNRLITEHPEIQVLGEVGLDYYHVKKPERHTFQREVFDLLCSLAKDHSLRMTIHSPDAVTDILSFLKQYNIPGRHCIFHWFSGTSEELQRVIEYGCFFSITPAVEYAYRHQQTALNAPKNKILTESDGDVKYRTGIRGSPLVIPYVIEQLAQLWGSNLKNVKKQVWQNFQRFFMNL